MAVNTSDAPATAAHQTRTPDPAWPTDVASILTRASQLLQAQGPQAALDFLSASRAASPWLVNAVAVCRLRLGQADRALVALRQLALAPSGFGLREDAPVRFKANYAAAQLLCGMHAACVVTLSQTRAEADPSVRRLREGVRRWRNSLPFWRRFLIMLGADGGPVTLEQPGDL
jgi:hypothetical protein